MPKFKYSFEFKKKVIQDYLKGKGGYGLLAKKYDIPTKDLVAQWYQQYKQFGYEGLKPKKKYTSYSFPFREKAVQLYLKGGKSYLDVSREMDMSNPTLIRAWVKNYLESGSVAYQNKSRKRKQERIMKVKDSPETDKDHKIEELEQRLHHARLEIDCLKASRRLEQKKRTKRKLKLFKASEKNINSKKSSK